MPDFNPALPLGGKFNIYTNSEEDRYNPGGHALRLQIPVQSVAAYAQYLMDLADNPENHKDVMFYDFGARQKVSAKAITVYHKGRVSDVDEEGWYGNINPAKPKPPAGQAPPSEMPF